MNLLTIEKGNFTWDLENREPTLQNINLQVKPGQLVAIVGPVGSGKSSLISCLLGEMDKISGRVNTKVFINTEVIIFLPFPIVLLFIFFHVSKYTLRISPPVSFFDVVLHFFY